MMNRLRAFFSAPFQLMLVISFSLIAAISIAIGVWAISRTISDYLSGAMNERVARDMQLAQSFYNLKLLEIENTTLRLSNDPQVIENIHKLSLNGDTSRAIINQLIANNLSAPELGGNLVITLLSVDGNMLAGQLLTTDDQIKTLDSTGSWKKLAILQNTMASGKTTSATEILPADLLAMVGLANQARITILETPKASPDLFDIREGSAGLALVSTSAIKDASGEVIGSVLAFHLLNNDFTLVDRIKEVAAIDTATIFLGDLRVSTNVLTAEGNRAIGTRISQEVGDLVLLQGMEFVGPAFVVNEDYITRYDPLRNHRGEVIGILYVGTRQASFQRLVNSFNQQIVLVAIGTILLTIVITTPVSRMITRPLDQLKDLVSANRRVAEGDMTVRVPVRAGGQVGLLESSFNTMLDTLQNTQDQLVQSEKLASLGQLAAGVAHELNNPLGTILLYSDIVKKETDPASPHADDLDIIVQETKRCKGIVSALLEFARQNQVIAQPTDLNNLILKVVELEIKNCEATSVQIHLKLYPQLPKIQADPAQLTQVVVNLIENALDAMPEGGLLHIRTSKGPEGMVTVEFEDTGMGIPAEHLSRLYTPFFTTKPIGKGTGLGLAIIYGIIKMHRGQIFMQSEVNKGTKFTIQLPIKLLGVKNLEQPNLNIVETIK
jgi:two-component system, NtrC family, sensor kinase